MFTKATIEDAANQEWQGTSLPRSPSPEAVVIVEATPSAVKKVDVSKISTAPLVSAPEPSNRDAKLPPTSIHQQTRARRNTQEKQSIAPPKKSAALEKQANRYDEMAKFNRQEREQKAKRFEEEAAKLNQDDLTVKNEERAEELRILAADFRLRKREIREKAQLLRARAKQAAKEETHQENDLHLKQQEKRKLDDEKNQARALRASISFAPVLAAPQVTEDERKRKEVCLSIQKEMDWINNQIKQTYVRSHHRGHNALIDELKTIYTDCEQNRLEKTKQLVQAVKALEGEEAGNLFVYDFCEEHPDANGTEALARVRKQSFENLESYAQQEANMFLEIYRKQIQHIIKTFHAAREREPYKSHLVNMFAEAKNNAHPYMQGMIALIHELYDRCTRDLDQEFTYLYFVCGCDALLDETTKQQLEQAMAYVRLAKGGIVRATSVIEDSASDVSAAEAPSPTLRSASLGSSSEKYPGSPPSLISATSDTPTARLSVASASSTANLALLMSASSSPSSKSASSVSTAPAARAKVTGPNFKVTEASPDEKEQNAKHQLLITQITWVHNRLVTMQQAYKGSGHTTKIAKFINTVDKIYIKHEEDREKGAKAIQAQKRAENELIDFHKQFHAEENDALLRVYRDQVKLIINEFKTERERLAPFNVKMAEKKEKHSNARVLKEVVKDLYVQEYNRNPRLLDTAAILALETEKRHIDEAESFCEQARNADQRGAVTHQARRR